MACRQLAEHGRLLAVEAWKEDTSRLAADDGAAHAEEGGGAKSGQSERLEVDRDSLEAEQVVQFELCTAIVRRGWLVSVRGKSGHTRLESAFQLVLRNES